MWLQKPGSGKNDAYFTAYIRGRYHYQENEKIIFDNIIYNTGSYDITNGIFTVPVSGIYALNLNLVGCMPTYESMSVRVRKNDLTIGYVGVGRDHSRENYITGSGTIILHMDKDDQVILDAFHR